MMTNREFLLSLHEKRQRLMRALTDMIEAIDEHILRAALEEVAAERGETTISRDDAAVARARDIIRETRAEAGFPEVLQ